MSSQKSNDDEMNSIQQNEITTVHEIDADSVDHTQEEAVAEVKAENVTDNTAAVLDALENEEDTDHAIKISLKFRSAKLVHRWTLDSKNEKCICNKMCTEPTKEDLQKKKIDPSYAVLKCGCIFHRTCAGIYFTKQKQNSTDPVKCPFCQEPYERIKVSDPEGVYVSE